VKVLKAKDLRAWDISTVLNTVRAWGPSTRLTLQQLQIKTIVLLTLATVTRPRSDIGKLQFRDVQLLPESVSWFFRESKEGQEKMSHLSRINDKTVCPVFNLELFLERSTYRREGLPEDHILFLACINYPTKQSCSIGEKTLAKWLKEVLEEADIDTTEYTAHSYRAAAVTKAIQQGAPIELVKKHANWSLNGDTLEKYYYKPFDQHRTATDMVEKKFPSQAEKGTTSGVEAEATTIVVGTAHNFV
jgi:integrase